MTFHKCPECGETNFAENEWQRRSFDCGFVGEGRRRHRRCDADKSLRPKTSIPAEVARYRLALLDAAQAAETIASDMLADTSADNRYARRCRDLAHQMREFAGHSTRFLHGREADRGNVVSRFLPKLWSR